MRRFFRLLFLFFHFQQSSGQTIQVDSLIQEKTLTGKVYMKGFFATSYNSLINWKEMNTSGVFFSGQLNLTCKKYLRNKRTLYELQSELGYFKFFDSTWFKTKDDFFFSIIKTFEKNKTIQLAISVNLKSQITDTWIAGNSSYKKRWVSGPLLPAAFMTGLGVNLNFKNSSYINISLAALKIKSIEYSKGVQENNKILAKTKNAFIYSEYGFNIQSRILTAMRNDFSFENRTILFINGAQMHKLKLDSKNIFSYKFSKLIKLQIESRLVYDYSISNKFQFSNETLLGFSLMNN